MSLEGLHAVVTGGGKGIGEAIARALATAGASVTIMGRDLQALNAVASEIKGKAIQLDVAKPETVLTAFDDAGAVDILVNNAGLASSAPFERTDEYLWHNTLEVNLTGAFRCTHAVLQGMKAKKFGRIVNVASTAGLKGYAYVSAYCAAKHGLVGFTRSLAAETARQGITVNAVCPGYTGTALLESSIQNIARATGRSEDEARMLLQKTNPQGRFIDPAEVAACVLWLCSREAAGITGQAIPIAGGEI